MQTFNASRWKVFLGAACHDHAFFDALKYGAMQMMLVLTDESAKTVTGQHRN